MNNEVIIGVSTVADGNMSVNWGDEEIVSSNREQFLQKLGIKIEDCVKASLLSGTEIWVVGNEDKGKMFECDALVTTEKGLPLWMVVGDCLPVVIYDPVIYVVALVHLGWRGVDGKLVNKVIKLLSGLGSQTKDLEIWIGPGIRRESYIWEPEVVVQKDDPLWMPFLENRNGMTHIDLLGYVKTQLIDSGVRSENIEDSGIDTGSDPNYFSHYRSIRTGQPEGRFAVVAILK